MITSVITAFNRPLTIKTAISSVLSQEGADMELIVINGNADYDPVDDVVQEFRDTRMTYVKDGSCMGLSEKHMKGLEMAKGEFIHFLDDDDWLRDPMFFDFAEKTLKEIPGLCLVSGTVDRMKWDGCKMTRMTRILHKKIGRVDGREYIYDMAAANGYKPRSTCSTIFRKSALLGGTPLFLYDDRIMYIKAMLNGDPWFMPNAVACYRVWGQSMGSGNVDWPDRYEWMETVMRQKEALYYEMQGQVEHPLEWYSMEFQRSFKYFHKLFRSKEERARLAEWGLAHSHGAKYMEAFCRKQMA